MWRSVSQMLAPPPGSRKPVTMGAQRATLLLITALVVVGASAAPPRDYSSGEEPTCVVRIGGVSLMCMPAAFSPELASSSSSAPSLKLVVADPPDGCTAPAAGLPAGSALLVSRGNCSFSLKTQLAAVAGAGAVIVRNSLKGMYMAGTNFSNPDSKLKTGPCEYDCALGSVPVAPALADPLHAYEGYQCESSSCTSGQCVLTGEADPQQTSSRQACCLLDDFMVMGGTPPPNPITTVFVTVAEGTDLASQATGGNGATVKIYERPTPAVGLSSIVIWAMGCGAVYLATWKSAAEDRRKMRPRSASGARSQGGPIPEEAVLDITVPQALGFLCCASVFLIALYGLIQLGVPIVLLITVFFCLGATSSTTLIVWEPLVNCIKPEWRTQGRRLGACGHVPYGRMVATGVAFVVVLFWFITRHANWSWTLQDAFGVCLCCMFLQVLRIGSLRVATFLLFLFFVYDIFMVFITPLIFNSSVMVDVATAGMPPSFLEQACYCRLNPDSELCGPGESMPILLRFPRLFDYRAGYSMLGLGDIAIPGMLQSFVLRWDVRERLPWKRGYFVIGFIGYCIGLAMANAAVQIMQLGQPALLYIVPMTVGPIAFFAYRRLDFDRMWAGKRSTSSQEGGRPLVADDSDDDDGETGGGGGADGGEPIGLADISMDATHGDGGSDFGAGAGAGADSGGELDHRTDAAAVLGGGAGGGGDSAPGDGSGRLLGHSDGSGAGADESGAGARAEFGAAATGTPAEDLDVEAARRRSSGAIVGMDAAPGSPASGLLR